MQIRLHRSSKTMTRLLLIATILIASTTGLAQTADEESLLHQAYELRLEGHDEAALPLLEQVYADDHSARVSAQLGLCEQALGHWMGADRHIRDALVGDTDPWVARHLDGLRAAHDIVVRHLVGQDPSVPEASASPRPEAMVEPSGPPPSEPPPQQHRRPRWTTVQDVGIVTAGVGAGILGVGLGSWVAREIVVASFNGAGCQVGDPNIPARCNETGATAQRDATTVVAASFIPVGAAAVVVGGVLFATGARSRSDHAHGFACTPELSSLTCGWSF